MKKLEDYLKYEQPNKYIVANDEYSDEYDVPVLTAGKSFVLGYTNDKDNIFPKEQLPVIIFDDFTTDCKYVDFPFKVKSSAMKILHPINNANAKFLYYYMTQIKFDNTLHKRYWISEYSQLLIKELSDVEQNDFVKKMSRIEVLINIRSEQIKNCNKLIKSQFVEMFENKDFPYVKFREYMDRCVDVGSNGANATVMKHYNMTDEKDYAMIIRFINLNSGDFEKDVKYINKDDYEFYSKTKVYGNEIIFCKIGSAGMNYIMPKLSMPVTLGLNQIMITPKNINTRYLYEYINSLEGKMYINNNINGAVTKTITKHALWEFPIKIPPVELQNKFANIAEQIDKQKFEFEKSLKKLEELQASLMQEYFG